MTENDASELSEAKTPLVVDLDGTLLATDTLHESLLRLVSTNPFNLFVALGWITLGRAGLKSRVAERVALDPSLLPLRPEVLDHLRRERARGRRTVLATAAHESIAHTVANHLGLFDHVVANGADGFNLKGVNKLHRVRALLGSEDFDYVGDSVSDRPIWQATGRALVVARDDAAARALASGVSVVRRFPRPRADLGSVLRSLRIHRWLKNTLIFLPLGISQAFMRWDTVLLAVAAFLAFGMCASATYVIEDLLNLPSDRKHEERRNRPIASGALSIPATLLLAAALMSTSVLTAAVLVHWTFLAILWCYAGMTITYALFLKKKRRLETLALASSYGWRVAAGALAIGMWVSP